MTQTTPVTPDDVTVVLEDYSFSRVWGFLGFMGLGMAIAGVLLHRLFKLQSTEGWALMQDWPWILPTLTLAHVALAYGVFRRDRQFVNRWWRGGPVDPAQVARLGWRSAPTRTPTEVSVFLIEATVVLRLAAYAGLALFGLFVLWVGIATSDLLKLPFYWVNAASYLFWWYSWQRSFLTRNRAKKLFVGLLPPEATSLPVVIHVD